MKIVYVLWSTAVMGGLETVTSIKVNKLSSLGYDVHIITRRQKGLPPYLPISERVSMTDLDVAWEEDYADPNPIRRRIKLQIQFSQYRAKLKKALWSINPDFIVFTSFSESEILGRSFFSKIKRQLPNCKIFLESHSSKYFGTKLPSEYPSLLSKIGKLISKNRIRRYESLPLWFDKFIVLTHEDQAQWQPLHNIKVIPNPIRFETDVKSDHHAKRIITVGRYSQEKGHLDLLQMWSEICAGYPEWQLVIVGDGPLRKEMEQTVERLMISAQTHLHPATSDVIGCLKTASIFCFTSYSEGLPMAMLEAQYIALPIVSFVCKCGPRDIIEDGYSGFLIENRDRELFKQRLIHLMEDEDLRKRMSENAYKASFRFSIDNVISSWDNLFKSYKVQ